MPGEMAPKPWETARLPVPESLYSCPGGGWHNIEYHDPDDLTWVSVPEGMEENYYDRWPGPDFYCSSCIFDMKRGIPAIGIPSMRVVEGPTLDEEMKRRGIKSVDID